MSQYSFTSLPITRITPAVKTEIEGLLEKWDASRESGSSDKEHEAGVDMAELLWRLHGGLPVGPDDEEEAARQADTRAEEAPGQ